MLTHHWLIYLFPLFGLLSGRWPAPTQPAMLAAPAGPTTWLTGDSTDVVTPTTGGVLLAGGSTDVPEAMQWLLRKSGGGDVVVLRASGADGYNTYLFSELGVRVNSVETILLNSRQWADEAAVARKIRNAEALFIAGGNQANYVNFWKDTKVEAAINYLIHTKKAPIGGTSAGCAVLGQVYYPAFKESLVSDEALTNPYHENLMLGRTDFISVPMLRNTITDTHFAQRNRQGRLVAFLARMRTDWQLQPARGIGVSEKTAIAIEPTGLAQVFGSGTAYFVTTRTRPEQCQLGKPLNWVAKQKALSVTTIQGTAAGTGTFDLNKWTPLAGSESAHWYIDDGALRL